MGYRQDEIINFYMKIKRTILTLEIQRSLLHLSLNDLYCAMYINIAYFWSRNLAYKLGKQ